MYVSDLTRLTAQVDPLVPRYDEYLGRRHFNGCDLTGPNPLYKRRGDQTGMMRSNDTEAWHIDLMAALWGVTPLPMLRLAQDLAESAG